tara:strand:- start:206 stop:439 length:234 start_codon:yes stop_codon:yes gene_type:complete
MSAKARRADPQGQATPGNWPKSTTSYPVCDICSVMAVVGKKRQETRNLTEAGYFNRNEAKEPRSRQLAANSLPKETD